MDLPEKVEKLLSDEEFQHDILKLKRYTQEERSAILEKYSISVREFLYARRFLFGFSFKNEMIDEQDINYSLIKLKNRIRLNSSPLKIETQQRKELVNWISKAAAVLVIPLVLSTFYYYRKAQSLSFSDANYNAQADVINTFQAPSGAKTQVILPDGSLVFLNSGSTLWCPTKFNSQSRDVKLSGEAYFEVVKNEKVPLIVSAGQLKVKVYGTQFNVQAFDNEGTIETTLVEGKVSIIPTNSKKEYKLKPGQTASYSIQKENLQVSKVDDMDVYIGWKDGKQLFHNERFADILKKLERWYNVDIQITDPSLGDYNLYATFFDENIEQVLDIFSNSIPITVKYVKRNKQPDGSYSKREIIIDRDKDKILK